MKIKDIYESTTAGAIATVAQPMNGGPQKRSDVGKGVYSGEKAGNLLKGKKTNKPFANSINESRVTEETLEEDDFILGPGQGSRLKSGFTPHEQDRRNREVKMAKDDLVSIAKLAKHIHTACKDVSEDEGLPSWIKDKVKKANELLKSVQDHYDRHAKKKANEAEDQQGDDYKQWRKDNHDDLATTRNIISKPVSTGNPWQDHDDFGKKVTDEGALDLFKKKQKTEVNPHADKSKEELKQELSRYKSKLSAARQAGSLVGGAVNDYINSIEHELRRRATSAINGEQVTDEGIIDNIKGAIRREKAKDYPILQNRRDYAAGKAGEAYNSGNIKKGDRYSDWRDKDLRKNGIQTSEGKKVDRMVKHIEKSERGLGKSKDKATDIAWATANKRGYLDNKNKKGK